MPKKSHFTSTTERLGTEMVSTSAANPLQGPRPEQCPTMFSYSPTMSTSPSVSRYTVNASAIQNALKKIKFKVSPAVWRGISTSIPTQIIISLHNGYPQKRMLCWSPLPPGFLAQNEKTRLTRGLHALNFIEDLSIVYTHTHTLQNHIAFLTEIAPSSSGIVGNQNVFKRFKKVLH